MCFPPGQVAGINLDQDDNIVHMSTSDSATALMTKKNRIFVCTDFTVKSIRFVCLLIHVHACATDEGSHSVPGGRKKQNTDYFIVSNYMTTIAGHRKN